MRVSIVIPAYNRRDLLKRTVPYLLAQEQRDFFELEIVIIDDGSTDGTHELLEDYKAQAKNLIYLSRQRKEDEAFLPARARNLGIQHSNGEIIVFLDCDMVIPPNFISRVAKHYLTSSNQVLVHYIVGVLALFNERDQQRLADISPENISQRVQQLVQDPEWIDNRAGLFNLVNDQLDHLPAPWTLFWSGAISVPRHLLAQVGGFDETFQGWGGEDTDLGFRLYRSGSSFVATRDCIAIHLPHERLPREQLMASSNENRRRIHRKAYRFETELFYYYPGPYYNQVLAYYNSLVSMNILPCYPLDTLIAIHDEFLQHKTPSLLIGTDNPLVAKYLSTTHNFVWNISTLNRFQAHFPEREVEYLLGCDTPHRDKYFDMVILTDFVRILPKKIMHGLFQELYRISRNILFLYTDAYIPYAHQIDEHKWASLNEITDTLEAIQLHMVLTGESNGTSVFRIQP